MRTFFRGVALAAVFLLTALPAANAAPKAPVEKGEKGDKSEDTREVFGSWSIAGIAPEGKAYAGTASFERIGGEMYRATWTVAGKALHGLCFRDGDVLSCGSSSSKDLGVMAYLIREDGNLDGVWFEENHASLGVEKLSGGPSTLAGTWTIKHGESPGKTKYTGSVEIEVRSSIYHLTWTLGKHTVKGIGLRSGDVLSVGFNDGADAGVSQYRLGKSGRTMSGTSTQTSPKGIAVETLARP
jgi:hypothetical protein